MCVQGIFSSITVEDSPGSICLTSQITALLKYQSCCPGAHGLGRKRLPLHPVFFQEFSFQSVLPGVKSSLALQHLAVRYCFMMPSNPCWSRSFNPPTSGSVGVLEGSSNFCSVVGIMYYEAIEATGWHPPWRDEFMIPPLLFS